MSRKGANESKKISLRTLRLCGKKSMASKVKTVNYGLIGCGGFGQFCLKAVAQMDGVRIAAVADADGALAEKTAKTFGAAAYPDAETG